MRHRAVVHVLARVLGNTWDHTGTRQSWLYTVQTPQGVLRFDSFAEWEVGDKRSISYEVHAGGWMFRPRPCKRLEE